MCIIGIHVLVCEVNCQKWTTNECECWFENYFASILQTLLVIAIMLPLLEGVSLQEAIRTTLAQLCKVGVVYQSAVAISGTIGVTIDKRQVILVHFDEHVECSPQVCIHSTVVKLILVEDTTSHWIIRHTDEEKNWLNQ